MDRRKLADHYHVLTGLPGYLPNNNWPCETLAEAGDMALYEADSFREGGYCSTFGKDSLGRVVGNRRDGYEVLEYGPGGPDEPCAWQTIRIEPCNEPDCRCLVCGALLYEDGCVECGAECN